MVRARWDILSVGDSTLDIFLDVPEATTECRLDSRACVLCFSYADKVPVRALKRVVGGNAANNAVGTARLGLRTAVYGVTGDDEWGRNIQRTLRAEGVDTRFLTLAKGQESNTSVVLSHKGERTILIYHVPRRYVWPTKLPRCRYLYLTSMRRGFEPNHPKIIRYLVHTKAKLVFQPGTFQLSLGLAKLKPLLKVTELLVLNREEAAGLLSCQPSAQIGELLHGLRQLGPKMVSVTDGQAGAWGCDGSACYEAPIFPGDRIEATGAGDAYATAFTAALALGKSFREAMAWGPVNAASVVGQIGPQAGLLTRSQLEGRLRRLPSYGVKTYEHKH